MGLLTLLGKFIRHLFLPWLIYHLTNSPKCYIPGFTTLIPLQSHHFHSRECLARSMIKEID